MSIPNDIIYELMLKASVPGLIQLCKVNKFAHTICQDQTFWETKTHLDFPNLPMINILDWKKFYVKFALGRAKFVPISIRELGKIKTLHSILIYDDDLISDIINRVVQETKEVVWGIRFIKFVGASISIVYPPNMTKIPSQLSSQKFKDLREINIWYGRH